MRISGTVAPGYEPVKEHLERQFWDGRGEKAQVCAYVRGEKVVDLWATARDDDDDGKEPYDGDSLHTVFSSTKAVTAVVFACLVDRGLVDYGDKICKHWPEFAQNGKEELRVEDVMRHEAGLAKWVGKIKYVDTLTGNIKENAIGKVIERESPAFPDARHGSDREYHALTRGWILNEVFRRAHPGGKTIGEYLRTEIAGPLGDIDVHIGAPHDGRKNQRLSSPSAAAVAAHFLLPNSVSNRVGFSVAELVDFGKARLGIRSNAARDRRKTVPLFGLTRGDMPLSAIGDVLDTVTTRDKFNKTLQIHSFISINHEAVQKIVG